ncbi:MAG TPA: lytic transglycosylase domain-containing protein [Spirochaetota bacterium]|nr:lytic transglycosylase domain-containing protein [Spirochaetota bacterium]HPV39986.1 lytic transglycosylase domain-containing protein [Spirochaetota bacterium]
MRHKIKPAKVICSTIIVAVSLLWTDTQLLSWGLFNLFTDTRYSQEGLHKVESFDPDRDILYLPPLKGKDIFESSRDLSICRNKTVRKHIYLYLTSKREYLIRAIERSYRYDDMIQDVMKKNSDIPAELALLPLLESCFDPRAVSSSRAVGLWQFVDNTARPLGLRSDQWIDERRDVEKSTAAAIRHIRNIRGSFPDWALTLAAYNGGAGYVKRTMEKTGIKDFWKLREGGFLRDETSEYIPKYIALMVIYKNQRLFGVSEEITVPKKTETELYTLRHPVDLRDVSRLGGVSLQTIRDLNPEINSNLTPPGIKNYQLRIPAEARKSLDAKTDALYKTRITGVIKHRVKKGESVTAIARLYKKKLHSSLNITR